VERPQAVGVVLLEGVQDGAGRLGPADLRVTRKAEQIESSAERHRDGQLVLELGQELQRERVPKEVLDPLLGDHLWPLLAGDPLQGRVGVGDRPGLVRPQLGERGGYGGVLEAVGVTQAHQCPRPNLSAPCHGILKAPLTTA
jgi:hypothetical protein